MFINPNHPLADDIAHEVREIVVSGAGSTWISPRADFTGCYVSELDADPEPPAARSCGYTWKYSRAADWLAEFDSER